MPWRGPEVAGEYPTLGYAVADWIEAHCVVPDGTLQGTPYRLTNEMLRFLYRFYRLREAAVVDSRRPSAPFAHRGGILMRPQKWGKGPFAAAICLAEAFGPVLFDGWDAAGEAVGRPQPTPWVQIVATSEEQTDNTYLALFEMASRGKVADFPGVDIGIQDINLPSGGKIEPKTSSGRARLGARLTFAVFDESHLMLPSNGGVLLASTMKRNIGGMSGRWLETTNAYDPSEGSVAQQTVEGKARDVIVDHRPADPVDDLDGDDEKLRGALQAVYGDSWWVDVDRIMAEIRDPNTAPDDARRFFLNQVVAGSKTAVDSERWDALARDDQLLPGEKVALGFDGSRSRDATSLIASRVSDGRLFHLRTWVPADFGGQVPRLEVDAAVRDAFDAYDVIYLFADPYRWQDYLDAWGAAFPKRVVEFPTNVERRMDQAIERFLTALRSGELTHDGHPVLSLHAKNAALAKGKRKPPREDGEKGLSENYLQVIKKREGHLIDAFVAAILAYHARGQAVEEGANRPAAELWGFYG